MLIDKNGYELSSYLGLLAAGDIELAQSIEINGMIPKAGTKVVKAESETECSYCAKTVQTGAYFVHEKPSSKFNDYIDLKNSDDVQCGQCYVLTHSGSKYLLPFKTTVSDSSGQCYSMSKDSEAFHFWYHLDLVEPFVVLRYTAKQAHMLWRSLPSYSQEQFVFNFDNSPFVVNKNRVREVLVQLTQFEEMLFSQYRQSLESLKPSSLKLTSTRAKLVQSEYTSVLGGNYKLVRELKDRQMGQLAEWINTSLLYATSEACLSEYQPLLERCRALSKSITQLNNGEMWWLYLLNKYWLLEKNGKLDAELKDVTTASMKINF